MLRIDRKMLDVAIDAMINCANAATNTQGYKIVWKTDNRAMEAAVLGALSIIAPNGGPCTASDVTFIHGIGSDDFTSFPPHKVTANGR